mmetsp:Transcript_99048/g.280542  ORF Transcript_99048/g.280542 Transcript_99048/m.280542 type:complete len:84 (+) Transcript_99048:114-365(+)
MSSSRHPADTENRAPRYPGSSRVDAQAVTEAYFLWDCQLRRYPDIGNTFVGTLKPAGPDGKEMGPYAKLERYHQASGPVSRGT